MSTRTEQGRRLGRHLLGVAASAMMLVLFNRLAAPWVVLGWVVLVPWLAVLEGVGSRREALLSGLAFSVGFTVAIFHWFPAALQDYIGLPVVVGWLLLVLTAPLLQPQFLTFAWARFATGRVPWRDGRALGYSTLASALVYVGTEWLAPKLFSDTLGHGLFGSLYLRQAADIAGAHGLTFLLLIGNECVLATLLALRAQGLREGARRARVPVAVLGALLLGGFGYGALRLHQVEEHSRQAPPLAVGVVQANITKVEALAAERGTYEVVRMILDTHFALSDELLRSGPLDVLVWPETVYPTTFGSPKSEEGAEFDQEIANFVGQRQVSLIFGSYEREEEREYNAALFLGPTREGRLELSAYRKTMLFPLTEWVPDTLEAAGVRKWLPWAGTWKRGPGPQTVTFPLRGGKELTVAPLICYDTLFPGYVAEEVRQGGELIVSLSNDSWFSGTPAPRMHLAQAAFRSIETRLPQVRATNSGISAFISPTGEVLARMDDNQRARMTVSAPRMARLPTLMVAWGDWLGLPALLTGVGLVLVPVLAARRRRLTSAAPPSPNPQAG